MICVGLCLFNSCKKVNRERKVAEFACWSKSAAKFSKFIRIFHLPLLTNKTPDRNPFRIWSTALLRREKNLLKSTSEVYLTQIRLH